MRLQKITDSADRWYDDACGTAMAMELVGERWSILIVRELLFGPRRFGELRTALRGLSANILTQRLAGLETAGIVVRQTLPPPASVQVYGLTDWGLEAETLVIEMGRWATRSPRHDPSLPLSAASLMMSFRTMFAADRAGDADGMLGFRLGADGFIVRFGGGRIDAARADPAGADAIVSGAPEAVAAVVYGGQPLAAPEAAGSLEVGGDRALVERFARLFPLPPKAG